MVFIKEICFTKEWINEKREALQVRDPGLLEKCIYAMELLGNLSQAKDFPFVFKGGTSLTLLLPTLRRLSIDIDIVSHQAPEGYRSTLNAIGSTALFVGFEEDLRGEDRLPKRRHFKFFYNSLYSKRRDYVLLDVLEEKVDYPATQTVPIKTKFIKTDSEITVTVPSIDSLAGDKLTAFAPLTVGVPLKPKTNTQVVKQVFDLGEMFSVVSDLEIIKKTHKTIFEAENNYRGSRFTWEQALQDTIETALLICQIQTRGGLKDDGRMALIQDGVKKVNSHIVGPALQIDQVKVAAAKTALLAAIILQNEQVFDIHTLRYSNEQANLLRELTIQKWPVLNNIKAANPEAFYYWWQASKIIV
ncbi:MAG: nucleotidyl transferase AbiEii/AbiGii toxin family protein [Deltaproteobacteria bacterium]|nr:nucleotidyl transferase AbiEii/AbiGii toxin family protein [Deltaproteobacteria bacterium]